MIDGILPAAPSAAPAENKSYRKAELAVLAKGLSEATVNEFAQQKKLDEIVVAVAQLAKLSFPETERLLMGVWPSPVAVIFKAIGFKLSTLTAIYDARLPSGKAAGPDLVRTKAEFIALSRPTAERILRFYQVRKTAGRGSAVGCRQVQALPAQTAWFIQVAGARSSAG